jgi:hypothetical protein
MTTFVRKVLAPLVLVLSLSACTPEQARAYLALFGHEDLSEAEVAAFASWASDWWQSALSPAAPGASPVSSLAPPPWTVWDDLAMCESTYRWNANTGNGYHGGLQFHPNTWRAYGGQEFSSFAYQASREEQIHIAVRVQAGQGWGAWPGCAAKLGLR